MTPERSRQIEELYHAARESTAEERASLLARADPELRRDVELLLSQSASGGFLENSTHSGMAPGACLGPYRIEGKLGEGGMGEVFRALDTRLGRSVAIKTARKHFNPRFRREARAIAALNHPNVCTLYDIGSNYLVMELVEGETLTARLKHGPLPVETALLYASQISAALVEAHAKGIIHRDLKPGNIMIGKTGIKVLDFGLARSEQDETVTATREIMGTPAYMALEQRQGKPTDARTDIYSFGCVLYEMLTAERSDLGRRRIRPRKLDAIVSRCLEGDPARRWQTAAELQQELAAVPRVRSGGTLPGRRATQHTPAPQRTSKPTPKHKIVLCEFENRTGDPVFDGILRQGLSVQLEQSPFLTLVSDQQVQQVLRLMNRPPETRITPDVAQEICERNGSTAVLEGSIAKLGGQYILWVRARNCRTGDVLGQVQAEVGRTEDVLSALTRSAMQVRARLTESLAAIQQQPTPLEEVTTPSLEALRAYSASRQAVFSRGFAAAISHLQRAISIDPRFAMAQADLGFYYWNVGQTDLGAEYVRKAYELRDQVCDDRERLFIHFLYDRQVTGNLQKELETLESWVRSYPDDFRAWGLLGGWGTRGTGQYVRGVQATEEALRLKPDLTLGYFTLVDHNLGLNRFAEAAAAMQRAAERNLEHPSFLISRYYLAFLEGDEVGMRREVDRARGNLETEYWMSNNQALVLARAGQMRDARIRWRHIIERQQTDHREQAAIYQAAEAVCEAHCGNRDRAKDRARAALDLGKGRDVEYAAAFALALSGDTSQVRALADDLAERFPEDTPVQFEYLPTLRALLALGNHAPLEAIEALQTALPYDLAMPGTAFFAKFGGLYPVYVRGQAYLAAGRNREAAAEFQRIFNHRGVVLADPIGALAHLQSGRALALLGERDSARSAYESFLTLWKDADPDIPVLDEARAEYATL